MNIKKCGKKCGNGKHLSLRSQKSVRERTPIKGKWIAGGVLLVLVLFGVVGLFVNSKLDRLNYDDGKIKLEGTVDEIRQQLMEDSGVDAEIFDSMDNIEMSDLEIIDDEGILNILLLGTDERDLEFSDRARSDAILLLSLDLNKHTIKLVSIERGLTVPVLLEGVPYGTVDLITHCFNYGGADLMMKEVEECLRVKVDRYVRVNLNVFIKVIEALGGVEVELTEEEANFMNELIETAGSESQALYYGDNERDFHANLKAGKNHLNGTMALIYARLRAIDSNWHRIVRQRNIIQACINSLKGADISTLNNMCNEILPLVKTNFTKKEITQLMLQAPNFIHADIEQMTIPAEGTFNRKEGAGGLYVYSPIFRDNSIILQEFFYGEVRTPVEIPG